MFGSDPDRLFARFRDRGDAQALSRVFDLCAPKLLLVARHLSRDSAEAEDLVQATFVTAIQSARSFDPGRALVPWLIGILARHAAAARRRARADVTPEEIARSIHPREEADPSDVIEQRELTLAVHAALKDMPDPYRQVLAIHLAHDKRPEEIARELGRAPGTVRVQIHRGLKLLRKSLPPGFATGAVAIFAPRGLAAVKTQVLAQAVGWNSAAISGSAAAVPIGGGIFMTKNIALAGAAAILVVGVSWLLTSQELTSSPQQETGGARSWVELASGTAGQSQRSSPPPIERALPDGSRDTTSPGERKPADAPAPIANGPRFILRGHVIDKDLVLPITDARITFFARDSAGSMRRFEAQSDESGHFTVPDVSAVPFGVRAVALGHAPYQWFRWKAEELAAALRSGSQFDLGDLELDRGVRIEGRVLCANGREGARLAPLFLVHRYFGDAPHMRLDHIYMVDRARADGSFALTDPLRCATSDPFEYALVAITDKGIGWRGVSPIAGGVDPLRVDLEVQAGAALEVVVRDAKGKPLAGAKVRATPRFDPFEDVCPIESGCWNGDLSTFDALTLKTTDAGGRALFEHLPLLDAGALEKRLGSRATDGQSLYEIAVAENRRSIALQPGQNSLAIQVEDLAQRTISGRVLDVNGRPIAGAHVRIWSSKAETDRDGSWRIQGCAYDAPVVEVMASAPGFADGRTLATWNGASHIENADVVLEPIASVRGRVVDQDKKPVEDVIVELTRYSSPGVAAIELTKRSCADGAFEFDQASNGRWFLCAWPPGDAAKWEGTSYQSVEGGAQDVTVVLRRATPGITRLVARIVDANGGAPLDAELAQLFRRVEWSPEAPGVIAPAVHPAAGEVTADGLRPGPWRLFVLVHGRDPALAEFDVEAGQREVHALVQVGAAGRIRGHVELNPGDKPAAFRIFAEISFGTAVPWGEAWASLPKKRALLELGADGSFELDGVLPGRWNLGLHHFARIGATHVDVKSGETASVELHTLDAGTLVFSGRTPIMDGFVWIQVDNEAAGWTSGAHRATVTDGRFEQSILVYPGHSHWKARLGAGEILEGPPLAFAEGDLVAIGGQRSSVSAGW